MTTLVLTVIGQDRPGLVNAIADLVSQHGGNWERSRLGAIAGVFAGVAEVTVADDAAGPLVEALRSVAGLDVTVHAGQQAEPDERRSYRMELLGDDRPGIVDQITRVLASHGVSVEEFVSETRDAPMAGGRLFEAKADLVLPAGSDPATVRTALEDLAQELLVSLDVADL